MRHGPRNRDRQDDQDGYRAGQDTGPPGDHRCSNRSDEGDGHADLDGEAEPGHGLSGAPLLHVVSPPTPGILPLADPSVPRIPGAREPGKGISHHITVGRLVRTLL